MSEMNRRESLKLMALASLAGGFTWSGKEMKNVRRQLKDDPHEHDPGDQLPRPGQAPEFFTEQEYETVKLLSDMIIPADERSGSATEAGVPAFMDFMMRDRPHMQTPMRGGLAWLNYQCLERFGQRFTACSTPEREQMLDLVAYPDEADSELSQGVAFFNSFRDLTASGFWSSKIGMEDLEYMGNTYVQSWEGCPEEVQDYLGVRYDE